jgi:hypothetical protein
MDGAHFGRVERSVIDGQVGTRRERFEFGHEFFGSDGAGVRVGVDPAEGLEAGIAVGNRQVVVG